jgi:uncharacterized protein HemX
MLITTYLAQSVETGAGGGGGIITVVYILTSISLIVGFIAGTYKYVQRQKKRWTEEGVTRERQAQATAENTAQMVKNTEAIGKLSDKFGEFATSVQGELNGLGTRIEKLEVWRQNQNQFTNGKPE